MTIAVAIWIALYAFAALIVFEISMEDEQHPGWLFVVTAIVFALFWPIPVVLACIKMAKGRKR